LFAVSAVASGQSSSIERQSAPSIVVEEPASPKISNGSAKAGSFTPTDPRHVFTGPEPTTRPPDQFVPPDPIFIPPPSDSDSFQQSGRVSLPDSFATPDFVPDADPLVDPCEQCETDDSQVSFRQLMNAPYDAYRVETNSLGWLPGGGDDFGWLDWTTAPYLDRDTDAGITGAINIHWLSGPTSIPLPPRLYDLSLGYQMRDTISDKFSYDIFASVGVFSDFEDSVRDGVRFPSHAVGMLHVSNSTDVVFGIDYLDRDDITILPVFGLSLHDLLIDDLRMDLVFPRPRIDYMLNDTNRLYLSGTMDGGTWDIELPNESDHVMTYFDLRLALGLEIADDDGDVTALEFGYVFDRRLEFRNVRGHMDFDDAFLIRLVSRH
jgi:hypothetical protein